MELDERMLKVERESAINSQKTETHRHELNELYDMLRAHMAKEEEQRQELIKLIAGIASELGRQKSFWAGITFATSAIWVVGIAAWHYFTK